MPIFQSESIVVDHDANGAVVLVLDVPGRTLNVLSRGVLDDLDRAIDAVATLGKAPLLILRSNKKSGFLAGVDIADFTTVTGPAAAEALSARGQQLFDKVAALPTPSLVVVHGPCLGGGLELALACDYRLVFDRPSTQLGLPEVELGLLPAWGGTQRLARVIGLERALQVILGGKRLNAREAFNWGLADAYAADEASLRDQLARLQGRAIGEGKRRLHGLPLRTWRQRLLESNAFGRRVILKGAERLMRKRVPDDMPAPTEAIEAIRTGLKEGMGAGLAYERAAAGRLALSAASRNLVTLFLQRDKARKLAEGSPDVRRVGVVGAGVMGAGIAQLAALKGCEVVVQEVNRPALDAGLQRLDDLFRKAVERRVLPEDEARQRRAAVRGTVAWEGFTDVDVVIEAAVEDLEVKRNLFRELENRTRPDTVLATNTSSLPVARLQEALRNPGRVAAMHFFNPVHKMPLVEVARTPKTEEKAADLLRRWAVALGKTPVVVGDGPGFVVNRVLMPYLNEAVLLIVEGMKIKDVDKVMKRFGMPMGPLQVLDEIGLDVAAHVAKTMEPALVGRFEPNPAFEKMRAAGWLGAKNGIGFFVHKGKNLTANTAAESLLRQGQPAGGAALPPAARLAEARERLVLLMVNEAALALNEGLADADTIDLAMVFGTGWAPHRGGPLRYADDRGVADVVRALEALARSHGKRFEPCAELRRRTTSASPFRSPLPAAV
jgi:3-hydroxyacyl-CoA dehydrogenase/enoyl-CoA hydratase/3-hydroxybutyryl-CoA epimerase